MLLTKELSDLKTKPKEHHISESPGRPVSVLNAVVDLSHHNGDVDLGAAKADGIVGVIQKATQGTLFVDPTFDTNRRKASDAQLLFGSYHFGTAGDGVAQAEHSLEVVKPCDGDLVVLW